MPPRPADGRLRASLLSLLHGVTLPATVLVCHPSSLPGSRLDVEGEEMET